MSKKKLCRTCNGQGWVINPKYEDVIFFIPPDDYTIDCPDCGGTGKRGKHGTQAD